MIWLHMVKLVVLNKMRHIQSEPTPNWKKNETFFFPLKWCHHIQTLPLSLSVWDNPSSQSIWLTHWHMDTLKSERVGPWDFTPLSILFLVTKILSSLHWEACEKWSYKIWALGTCFLLLTNAAGPNPCDDQFNLSWIHVYVQWMGYRHNTWKLTWSLCFCWFVTVHLRCCAYLGC